MTTVLRRKRKAKRRKKAPGEVEQAASGSRFVFGDRSTAEDILLEIPKWIIEWEYGTSTMAMGPVKTMDSYPRAWEIFVALIGTWTIDAYNVYIGKFVIRTHIATTIRIQEKRKGDNPMREDLHGKWPDRGEDDAGNLMKPEGSHQGADEEVPSRRPHVSQEELTRDNIEGFTLAFEGMKLLSKIMRYWINCGWVTAEIKEELGSSDRGKWWWENAGFEIWLGGGFKCQPAWDCTDRHATAQQICSKGDPWSVKPEQLHVFSPWDQLWRDDLHQSSIDPPRHQKGIPEGCLHSTCAEITRSGWTQHRRRPWRGTSMMRSQIRRVRRNGEFICRKIWSRQLRTPRHGQEADEMWSCYGRA